MAIYQSYLLFFDQLQTAFVNILFDRGLPKYIFIKYQVNLCNRK